MNNTFKIQCNECKGKKIEIYYDRYFCYIECECGNILEEKEYSAKNGILKEKELEW